MRLRMFLRNAFRHKLRTALTLVGMLVAILAFGLLRTVIDAWYGGVEASAANRLITRSSISLAVFLPMSAASKIKAVDGVRQVSWGYWYGGVYIDPKNFFANFAYDLPSVMALYPEFQVDEGQKLDLLRDRKGALVGAKLARRFGWKVGDTVVLQGTIFPGDMEFTIRAIYRGRDKNVDETQFLFHWDYLNETLKKTAPRRADQAGWFMVGIDNPDRAADIAQTIDERFKNSLSETMTETEKAFQMGFVAMSQAIIVAVEAVSYVVIAIILIVVANTMAMSVRERRSEFGVFRTLGFGGGWIAGLIFGESLVLTGLGGLLGILATYPAAQAFGLAVGDFFPIFRLTPETIVYDAIAALTVGLLAAVVPAIQAARTSVAHALRKVG